MSNSEELRLAVVMNGGVSLAVWMGGVTHEFGRFMGEVPESGTSGMGSVYEQLRRLTSTRVRIDVICGTSAGGINGAYLGLAIARHGQRVGEHTSALRDVWIKYGAMSSLLRSPFDDAPPSILDGDGSLAKGIREALKAIPPKTIKGRGEPLALVMPTTLLAPAREEISDVFGNRLTEVSHRAQFEFIRGEEGADPFLAEEAVARLVVAARSTASFPGAFEPHFVRIGGDPNVFKHPDMDGIVKAMPNSGFVTDGGVLENSPIARALELIFKQRAGGPVRRILAFVVPDPSVATPQPGADPNAPPGPLSVAFDAMVRIPRSQGVSGQIEELRQHNEAVRQRRRDRILLTRTITPSDMEKTAAILFEVYRAQRVQNAARRIVDQIDGVLAEKETDGLGRRGRRAWLVKTLTGFGDSLPFVPTVPPGASDDLGERQVQTWRWGAVPVQHMARLFLDLVSRTQRVANFATNQPDLLLYWRSAFESIEDIERVLKTDQGRWPSIAEELIGLLGGPNDARGTAKARQFLKDAVERWKSQPPADSLSPGEWPTAGRIALRIAEGILAVTGQAKPMLKDLGRSTDEVVQREIEDLDGLINYFCRCDGDTASDVLRRLLVLEVVQEASGPTNIDFEQEIDYVQVSADQATMFGGPDAVEDRLTGLQLAHFGAFYKGSWRANDWMWGRLNAVGRLVLVLLEPNRILAISRMWPEGQRAQLLAQQIKAIAVGRTGNALYTVLEASFEEERVVDELRFLDDPERLMPERLVVTADALIRRLHLEILREELPIVADQVKVDLKGEHGSEDIRRMLLKINRAMRDGYIEPSRIMEIMSEYSVGSQRLVDEIGTDRMTLAATQALAVSVAALKREATPFRILGNAFTVLRLPTLAIYLLARNSTTNSRTAVGLNIALFVFGLTILLTHFIASNGIFPWWLIGLAALGFVGAIAWGLARERVPTRWVVEGLGSVSILTGLLFATGGFPSPNFRLDTGRAISSISFFAVGAVLIQYGSRFPSNRIKIFRRLRHVVGRSRRLPRRQRR